MKRNYLILAVLTGAIIAVFVFPRDKGVHETLEGNGGESALISVSEKFLIPEGMPFVEIGDELDAFEDRHRDVFSAWINQNKFGNDRKIGLYKGVINNYSLEYRYCDYSFSNGTLESFKCLGGVSPSELVRKSLNPEKYLRQSLKVWGEPDFIQYGRVDDEHWSGASLIWKNKAARIVVAVQFEGNRPSVFETNVSFLRKEARKSFIISENNEKNLKELNWLKSTVNELMTEVNVNAQALDKPNLDKANAAEGDDELALSRLGIHHYSGMPVSEFIQKNPGLKSGYGQAISLHDYSGFEFSLSIAVDDKRGFKL